MTAQSTRAERVDLQAVREDSKRYSHRFQVGNQVLAIRGKALIRKVKWPAFKSKYQEPCSVTKVIPPCY